MKNQIVQYKQEDNRRYIAFYWLSELYAYVHAYTLNYNKGILAIQDIEGECDKDKKINVLVEEVLDDQGQPVETFAMWNGEKIKLEGLDLA